MLSFVPPGGAGRLREPALAGRGRRRGRAEPEATTTVSDTAANNIHKSLVHRIIVTLVLPVAFTLHKTTTTDNTTCIMFKPITINNTTCIISFYFSCLFLNKHNNIMFNTLTCIMVKTYM